MISCQNFHDFEAEIMVPARRDGAACGRHAPAAPPPPASPSHASAKRRCIEAIGASSMDLEFKLEWYYSSSCGTGPGHGQPTARPVGGEMLKLLLCTGDRTVLSLATQIELGCLVVASSFKSSSGLDHSGLQAVHPGRAAGLTQALTGNLWRLSLGSPIIHASHGEELV